jgi:hypothetical protein
MEEYMRLANPMALCAGILCAGWLAMAPGHAQQPQSWISGTGDDANSCTRAAPCRTLAGGFSRVQTFGVVTCLDPAGYGTVTITRSVTIDCHNRFASVGNSNVAILIDFDRFIDASRTVRIRNLSLEGANIGNTGVKIVGAQSGGSAVIIEDCVIDGNFASGGAGIVDARSGGGALYVTNTTVRNMAGNGIAILPASGSTQIQATIDKVMVAQANTGLLVADGATAMVGNSVLAGNAIGVKATTGARLILNASVINANAIGILASGATIRVANSDIAFNAVGVSGAIASHTNSRFTSNGGDGAIEPLGLASKATGQQ